MKRGQRDRSEPGARLGNIILLTSSHCPDSKLSAGPHRAPLIHPSRPIDKDHCPALPANTSAPAGHRGSRSKQKEHFRGQGRESVIFEATVSEERQGYIALDDIVLLNYPCCKYPILHFSYPLTFTEPTESVRLNIQSFSQEAQQFPRVKTNRS
ncbi:hypothetical protein PAMP_007713 [Pampus punctatissimus]